MSTSTQPQFVMKLSEFKVVNFRGARGFDWANKYYLQLNIGEIKHKTPSVSSQDGSIRWNDVVFFDACGSHILCVRLYTKRIGKDKLISEVKDSVDDFLDGQHHRVLRRSLVIFKDSSSGPIGPSELIFSITVDTSGANAVDRATGHAVNQAQEQARQQHGLSALIRAVNKVVGTANKSGHKIVTASDAVSSLLDKVAKFNDIVETIAEIHPYTTMAWKIISTASNAVITQDKRDKRVLDLLRIMDDVYALILEAEPLKRVQTQQRALETLAKQTTESAYFISHYFRHPKFWTRLGRNILGSVDDKIAGFEKSFQTLRANFGEGLAVNTELFVLRMISDVEAIGTDIALNDMSYAKGAGYVPEKGCMAGTREEIIQEITDWVNLPDCPDTQQVCWLSGMAGTGKSAIAHTLASRFREIKRLGSSFFFDASVQDERHVSNLFTTIAVDLADLDGEWRKSLWNIVKDDKALRTTSSVELQFLHFILKPTESLKTVGPILFVIDAADESGNKHGRAQFLRTLVNKVSALPSNFRILITSRPDPDIEEYLGSNPLILRKCMEDIPFTSRDIRCYIEHQLGEFSKLDHMWPNGRWLDDLVTLAEGLFQWAFTACRYVKGDDDSFPDPVKQLASIFSPESSLVGLQPLDKLYHQVLRQKYPDKVPSEYSAVLGSVLVARRPLSMTALKGFIKAADEDCFEHPVDLILRPLGSLLSGVSQTLIPVLPLHTSFRDFLQDQERSMEFYVDISMRDADFTVTCLDIMQKTLRFNICKLETSYLDNRDVPDLSVRIDQAISPHLSYACLFWADHLSSSTITSTVTSQVNLFMKTQFLHWLEVMSLTNAIPDASSVLQTMEDVSEGLDDETASLVADASRFVSAFAAPISRSAPHIYISALPFAPLESSLSEQYVSGYIKTLSVEIGKTNTWPAALHVLEGHDRSVQSVAFSHTGRQVASGSFDHTVRIWDAQTGALVAGPFQGHDNGVNSVAFSHDGKRVASGSDDCTVRIWDAQTGALVAGPFQGHRDLVNSVAFSHDGKRVASGSFDRTVRIWDAETGALVAGPFQGHDDLVNSVAFSHDGKRVASGSLDRTILIWDAHTGARVGGPFRGHRDSVRSVAFSHDGKRVASGSFDRTVRIWDAQTGFLVAGPFQGHHGWVYSVAFSHNGKWVTSGSRDRTVRIWDAQSGALVAGPFQGHDDMVNSVAFSHNGKWVASGSDDHTVRVWDAHAGVLEPFDAHDHSVNSVTFSHDGKRVASGSDDHTVRIWDAQTGALISGPFRGHKDCVTSVAFSHNGNWIASGSRDRTVRIWNTQARVFRPGPFEGHHDQVNSVVFSHDGTRVASGSLDRTVRIWDAQTGALVAGPFQGHDYSVASVAFSQDGQRVASGSHDRTVRIWDAQTGALVAGPFQGHAHWVKSVAFSHDGKQVTSGSLDRTIRIWDAHTGALVAGPFQGHDDHVNSVSFSHDGKRVASGSHDCTVRIWEAQTGILVAGPFRGHDDSVNSVAFSHDGIQVVSGSSDRTVRIWDAQPSAFLPKPSEQPHSLIGSIPFSHDTHDTRPAVPGSPDLTSRIWTLQRDSSPIIPLHMFRDNTVLREGWVLGPHGELVFWVPPVHRLSLFRPSTLLVIGGHPTKLDLSHFVHGSRWAECRSGTV